MTGKVKWVSPVVGIIWRSHLASRYRRYVGAVSYISVDQLPRSGRGVVVASETGVLAVLDPQDGSLGE